MCGASRIGHLAGGIWLDVHHHDMVVEGYASVLNRSFGLLIELNNGPHLVRRNLQANRGLAPRNKRFPLASTLWEHRRGLSGVVKPLSNTRASGSSRRLFRVGLR